MASLVAFTLVKRWYVFAFMALYLLASLRDVGWRRTLAHLVVTIIPMTLIEELGTVTGFPFGSYHYVAAGNGDELWIGDVILASVLAWPFLTYAGWAMARWVLGDPSPRWSRQIALATLFLLLLDVVMDPVTARGDRWFLGPFHTWDEPGVVWGVPWQNYAGWALSLVLIYSLWQWLDRRMAQSQTNSSSSPRLSALTWPVSGVLLYATLWAFQLGVAFAIGEWGIGLVGMCIASAIGATAVKRVSLSTSTSSN